MGKPSLEEFEKACYKFAGIKTDIGKSFGVTRQTIHNWSKEDVDFENALKQGNVRLVDLAVKGLADKLEEGSERSILYTLDRLAREKGFGKVVTTVDKSKLHDQFDDMTEDEILKEMEDSRKRISE